MPSDAGGAENPAEYASLLEYAVKEFKFVNPDFFIISAGLDNAAPNQPPLYMNEYNYMQSMNQAVPGIFAEVDGLASHSYPNPGFSQPPTDTNAMSISSFTYEQQQAQQLGGKKLPIFITETGWSSDTLSNISIAQYYKQALETVWSDPSIVAITPFLLSASQGSFTQFSFLKSDGTPTEMYQAIEGLQKVKGQPLIPSTEVLSATTSHQHITSVKNFVQPVTVNKHYPSLADEARIVFKFLFIH